MKKTFIKVSLFTIVASTIGGASVSSADIHIPEKNSSINQSILNASSSLSIPSYSAGYGEVNMDLSREGKEAIINISIQLNDPKPYFNVKFFTDKSGLYKSNSYNSSGKYEFRLNAEEIEVLKSQLTEDPYAFMHVDVLNSDKQIPGAMIFVSDVLEAYNSLSSSENSDVETTSSLTVNPFDIKNDSVITGTLDTRDTETKDTLMLMINGAGRRLVHFNALPEDKQSATQKFEIRASDYVTSLDKKVSIVHIKDGKVVEEINVPLV